MDGIKLFLNTTPRLRELLDTYLELRVYFQELGFTEAELEKPTQYTGKMMQLFHKFGNIRKELFHQIKEYGFKIEWTEFVSHIIPLLQNINELTPLSDVNSKRADSWNEDN